MGAVLLRYSGAVVGDGDDHISVGLHHLHFRHCPAVFTCVPDQVHEHAVDLPLIHIGHYRGVWQAYYQAFTFRLHGLFKPLPYILYHQVEVAGAKGEIVFCFILNLPEIEKLIGDAQEVVEIGLHRFKILPVMTELAVERFAAFPDTGLR